MNIFWKHLNNMPAAYRKKTTDAFVAEWHRINRTTEKERKQLQENEARDIAAADPVYEHFFGDKMTYRDRTFSNLEGNRFMVWEDAQNAFIIICQQLDPSYAGQVITIWEHEKKVWLQLSTVFNLLKKESV